MTKPAPPFATPTEALAAKIAAEGVYVIESKLYTVRVPFLTEDRGPALIVTAGTHGPEGGFKKRVVLLPTAVPLGAGVPVHLAFAEQELVRGQLPTSASFLLIPFVPPLVLILQPGQSIWARSSTADRMLVSVATSVA